MRIPTGPLREKSFRRYFTGQALSQFGDAVVPLALTFAVLDIDASAGAIGLVLLANRLPVIALVLFGGVAGDRWPPHRVMLVADAARCAIQAVTAVLLLTGRAELWHLMALQAGVGAASAFFTPAAAGLLPATVSKPQLQQANALVGLSRNATMIVAAGISATLVATVGAGWALAVDAATFAASGISLALLAAPLATRATTVGGSRATAPGGSRAATRARTPLRQLADGWRLVTGRTWLWAPILHICVVNTVAIAPFMVLGPLVAYDSLGGAPAWAAIGTGYSIGAICGGIVSLRVEPRNPLRWGVLVVFALCPFLALLAIPGPTWALALAAALAGGQASFSAAMFAVTTQTHVPADSLARVSSYIQLGTLVLVPLSFGATGALAEWLGAGTLLWISCAAVAGSTALTLALRPVRDLPREPADARTTAREGTLVHTR